MAGLLGVHCSTSGGIENAFREAARLEIDTFQIFTRNQRQWKAKPVSEVERTSFLNGYVNTPVTHTVAHASYLINLAAGNEEIRLKSILALKEEVERCHLLRVDYCVLHPGAAGEQTFDEAMDKIAEALRYIIDETRESKVMILLENTAGQGSSVGGKLENLSKIYQLTGSERIGYCVDTCHAFAAGYDIRSQVGFEVFMEEFERILGLEKLKVFHLNDSKGELGSHLDRHEHIGQGKIGLEAFRQIMHRFPGKPKVLETPKENEMDYVNLNILRSL